jgi:hypothetical protein
MPSAGRNRQSKGKDEAAARPKFSTMRSHLFSSLSFFFLNPRKVGSLIQDSLGDLWRQVARGPSYWVVPECLRQTKLGCNSNRIG